MISFLGTKRDSGLEAQKCWDVDYEGAKGETESESKMPGRDHPVQELVTRWDPGLPSLHVLLCPMGGAQCRSPPSALLWRARPAQSQRAFLQSAMPAPVSADGERLTLGSLLGGQVSGSRV